MIAAGWVVLACALAGGVRADGLPDENNALSPDWALRVGRDIGAVATSPARWTGTEWVIAGGILGGTAAAFTVDSSTRRRAERWRSGALGTICVDVAAFGDWRFQAPFLGCSYLAGWLSRDPVLRKVAADGAEASLIAAGLINPLIVWVSGRDLPSRKQPVHEWHPFSRGRVSFPSGHTAEAFAMAAVLDCDLQNRLGGWRTPVLYGIASLVGLGRVLIRAHYVSDVILGAGIGWAVGSWVAHRPRNAPAVSVVPSSAGLSLALSISR